ncbi:hypothetical protein ANCDUO_06807 [Ancylostoma duodenale]|uniref:Uncharacterized protein n=1 Tax=Ancylostoma duodenale TaxID=51022 RepID=A0A0C2DK71_9BILA|nr:hypothetical protein ANCDUO_06807 [Ancylostoma duodenale]
MLSKPMLGFFVLLAVVIVFIVFLDDGSTPVRFTKFQKRLGEKTIRWIVVTTVQHPTEGIKRLSQIPGWTLLVVGNAETPKNWSFEGVHYLSVEDQQELGYRVLDFLPYKSYARKNIGYLYAIENGAEWIYDTDDDIIPYGLGPEQFDYTEEISGLRYGSKFSEKNESENSEEYVNTWRQEL